MRNSPMSESDDARVSLLVCCSDELGLAPTSL